MIRKINFLFLTGVALTLLLSVWMDYKIKEKNLSIVLNSYLARAREFLPLIVDENIQLLKRKARENGFEMVGEISGRTIYDKKITFGRIKVVENGGRYYLKIEYLNELYTFFDKNQNLLREQIVLYMFILGVLAVFAILYLLIRKILKPLRDISHKLSTFSSGKYDVEMEIAGEDEIRILAGNFNEMTRKIKNSIQERENLIKYIGHELKTPLAKMRFAIAAEDLKKIARLTTELETLTNELIFIHLITKENMRPARFKASTLIARALSKLYIDGEEKIRVDVEDFDISGDLDYLAIALKNLIDNAVKYGSSYPVEIKAKKGVVSVCSSGEKIEMPLDEMTKLFVKKSKGFGIGLSIVKKVCNIHGFEFSYLYRGGRNCFEVSMARKDG